MLCACVQVNLIFSQPVLLGTRHHFIWDRGEGWEPQNAKTLSCPSLSVGSYSSLINYFLHLGASGNWSLSSSSVGCVPTNWGDKHKSLQALMKSSTAGSYFSFCALVLFVWSLFDCLGLFWVSLLCQALSEQLAVCLSCGSW